MTTTKTEDNPVSLAYSARPLARLLLVCTLLFGVGGCGAQSSEAKMGGESHFLESCHTDCSKGLECIAGMCTQACKAKSDSCADLHANATCEAVAEQRVCTINCKADAACKELGSDLSCNDGVCSPELGADTDPGGSTADDDVPTDSDGAEDSADDVSTANVTVDDEASADDEVRAADDPGTADTADTADESTSEHLPDAPMPVGAEEGPATQVDLLFVIDNSYGMADKQALLGLAIPDLVQRLTSPVCVNEDGAVVDAPSDPEARCASGDREFAALNDIHFAVISTSLGGYGAQFDCAGLGNADSLQALDMAHLLGTLPRGGAASPSAMGSGFLTWAGGSDRNAFSGEFTSLVRSAGEFGCGWEATLESWYRFLVDPFPYTKIVRQACSAADTAMSCAGPELGPEGTTMVDIGILNQRKQFLRPSSVLGIIMLSDENDCSFKASGQSWRLSQSAADSGDGNIAYFPAFRATAACSDPAYGPNHECCDSCGTATVPGNCPTATDQDGQVTAAGCENGRKFTIDEISDHPNLRCFEQKRRFGIDYLYPVERYSNALQLPVICPFTDDVSGASCDSLPAAPVQNPLYADLGYAPSDPDATPAPQRSAKRIFLAGILGVPWQDIAVDADVVDAESLHYRVARSDAPQEQRLNWDLILGPDNPADGIQRPLDPLMQESIAPRTGTQPITGEAIAPPGSDFLANSINGHEWAISDESDLQYACVFPIAERVCPSREESELARDQGQSVSRCECTDYPGDEWGNPLCQDQDGSFGQTQRYGHAYPGLRELQVLKAVGDNAIVASICPKNIEPTQADFGYRPAVNAIIERLREQLE